jgi:hypothetical protein
LSRSTGRELDRAPLPHTAKGRLESVTTSRGAIGQTYFLDTCNLETLTIAGFPVRGKERDKCGTSLQEEDRLDFAGLGQISSPDRPEI